MIQRINTVLHLKNILPRPRTAAVILAGGIGTRMRANKPKQQLMLCDKPVWVHTALAFQKCRFIDEIVLVVRSEDIAQVKMMCYTWKLKKCKAVVAGGDTRQESAQNGFRAITSKVAFVAFHDAARCLITPMQIGEVAVAAYAYGAASAATPAIDTVKVANRYGFIDKTIPREQVWLAATPQIFQVAHYAAAMQLASQKNISVTDDNSLMELIGQRVKLVDTGNDNFKITLPSDLARAELILRARGK